MVRHTGFALARNAGPLFALGVLFFPAHLSGQEPGPPALAPAELPASAPLSLEEAERRALEASPALKAARARVRLEEGRLQQARLYPNPDLALDTFRFTDGSGPKETIFSLRQPIPYPGKRGLEQKGAAQRIEAARRDVDRERLDLLLEVRQNYYRIHFTAEIVKVEEEDLEATRALRRAVEPGWRPSSRSSPLRRCWSRCTEARAPPAASPLTWPTPCSKRRTACC